MLLVEEKKLYLSENVGYISKQMHKQFVRAKVLQSKSHLKQHSKIAISDLFFILPETERNSFALLFIVLSIVSHV